MHLRPAERFSPGPASPAATFTPRADLVPSVERVPFPSWRRARDQACALLLAGERVILVIGASGMGKTVLLEDLAQVLRSAGWLTTYFRPEATLPLDDDGSPAVLLVDDAEQLSQTELSVLCRTDLSPVVMTGSEALHHRFPDAACVRLHALDLEQTRIFVRLWHEQTRQREMDEASAVRLLALSGGIPRLLAILLNAGIWHQQDLGAPPPPSPPSPPSTSPPAPSSSAPAREALRPELALQAAPVSPPRRRRAGRRAAVVGFGALLLLVGAGATLTPAVYLPDSVRGARERAEASARLLGRETVAEVETLLTRLRRDLLTGPTAPASGPPWSEVSTLPPPTQAAIDPAPLTSPAPNVPIAPQPLPPPAPASAAPIATAEQPIAPSAATASLPPELGMAPAPVVPETNQPLPEATIDLLLRRGNEMLALADFSAARLLFARAARAGNTDAAQALERTEEMAARSETGSAAIAAGVAAAAPPQAAELPGDRMRQTPRRTGVRRPSGPVGR